jgi:hypothetical protein
MKLENEFGLIFNLNLFIDFCIFFNSIFFSFRPIKQIVTPKRFSSKSGERQTQDAPIIDSKLILSIESTIFNKEVNILITTTKNMNNSNISIKPQKILDKFRNKAMNKLFNYKKYIEFSFFK